MITVEVQIPGNEYALQIGTHILESSLLEAVQRLAAEQVVVVTNATLENLYPNHLQKCLAPLQLPLEICVVPDGETYKTLETLKQIYDFLLEKQANRKTLLIAWGGGVVGDMTGFAAATYMRGIPYIQVPTTLLAQVDSSIGGKTAVNHPLGKNTIGAFKQPAHVCIDLHFLQTLPPRELKAGFFELLKHGLIHEARLFDFLQKHPHLLEPLDFSVLAEAIAASCRVKARIVAQDETEKGLRATLNFGHTLGHLLETHTHYQTYLHGEAVGVGMAFAAFVSHQLQFLSQSALDRVLDALKPHITCFQLPPLSFERFQELILHDKKSSQRSVNFILLRAIGESFIHPNTSPDLLWDCFQQFIAQHPWACDVRPQ